MSLLAIGGHRGYRCVNSRKTRSVRAVPLVCVNTTLTLTKYFLFVQDELERNRAIDLLGMNSGEIMHIWLESDAVAVWVLLFGLVAVELLAFNI